MPNYELLLSQLKEFRGSFGEDIPFRLTDLYITDSDCCKGSMQKVFAQSRFECDYPLQSSRYVCVENSRVQGHSMLEKSLSSVVKGTKVDGSEAFFDAVRPTAIDTTFNGAINFFNSEYPLAVTCRFEDTLKTHAYGGFYNFELCKMPIIYNSGSEDTWWMGIEIPRDIYEGGLDSFEKGIIMSQDEQEIFVNGYSLKNEGFRVLPSLGEAVKKASIYQARQVFIDHLISMFQERIDMTAIMIEELSSLEKPRYFPREFDIEID